MRAADFVDSAVRYFKNVQDRDVVESRFRPVPPVSVLSV